MSNEGELYDETAFSQAQNHTGKEGESVLMINLGYLARMNLTVFDVFTPTQWLSLVGVILLCAVVFYIYKYRQSDAWRLKQAIKQHAKEHIKDAVLFDGVDSYLFADDVLLLQGKILIIKRDDSEGYIYGAGNIHEWTCVKNHVTAKFNNPLEKLGHFVTQVQQECDFEGVMGGVLFGSQAEFPKGVPEGALQMQTLTDDLQNLQGDAAQHEAAIQAWAKLKAMIARDTDEVGLLK